MLWNAALVISGHLLKSHKWIFAREPGEIKTQMLQFSEIPQDLAHSLKSLIGYFVARINEKFSSMEMLTNWTSN